MLLSPAYRQGELEHALSLTEPALLIADERLSEHVERTGYSGSILRLPADEAEAAAWYHRLAAGCSGARLELALDPETTEALLPFSSGTTGLPKAVRHTHRSLVVGSLQWKIALGLGPAEELIDRVKRELASYKSPVWIDFVEEIPRTASGKALRRVLAERFGAAERAGGPGVASAPLSPAQARGR